MFILKSAIEDFNREFFELFYLLGEKWTQLGEDWTVGGVVFECCLVAVENFNVFALCLKIRAKKIRNLILDDAH